MRAAWMIVAVLATGPNLPLLGNSSPAQRDVPILLTQVPVTDTAVQSSTKPVRPLLSVPGEGGRVVVVFPDGGERVLTGQFHSACDPAISFDAKRFLFAAKRSAADNWNIFEMELDGAGVRQITRNSGNCRYPGYQSTLYTIVSTEPWYQLTFVSDAANTLTDDNSGTATNLYSCKVDGSNIRRITYNISGDTDPFLMGDGRIVYASWQRNTLFRGTLGRSTLFGVSIDGADVALFADPSGRRFKRMPTVTTKGLVVFIESDDCRDDGSGQVARVTFRRPLKSYQPVTKPADGLFHSPSPWTNGTVLVSHRPADGTGTFAIRWLDARTGQSGLLYDNPGYHDIQAKVIQSVREPDGRSSVVNQDDPFGKLYCLDAYRTDLADPNWLPAGSIHRLRVLEGVPLPVARQARQALPVLDDLPARREGSTCNGIPPLVQQRILGDFEISPDGSFNIQVPANIPIQLQTLDENGMVLRTCGWIWSRNHERRGCIGCHEDGELTPDNIFVDAVRRPSIPLTLPPDRRRTVDFRRDVMPIIEQKCVGCHGSEGAVPRLDGGKELIVQSDGNAYFNRAYLSLLATRKPDAPVSFSGRYVHPGRARTSPLIWHLFGRNTARPWDGQSAQKECVPIPPGESAPLTNQDLSAFVEWVDMGAMWDGIPEKERLSDAESVKGED